MYFSVFISNSEYPCGSVRHHSHGENTAAGGVLQTNNLLLRRNRTMPTSHMTQHNI